MCTQLLYRRTRVESPTSPGSGLFCECANSCRVFATWQNSQTTKLFRSYLCDIFSRVWKAVQPVYLNVKRYFASSPHFLFSAGSPPPCSPRFGQFVTKFSCFRNEKPRLKPSLGLDMFPRVCVLWPYVGPVPCLRSSTKCLKSVAVTEVISGDVVIRSRMFVFQRNVKYCKETNISVVCCTSESIHFNIILTSKPASPKQPFPFRFSD